MEKIHLSSWAGVGWLSILYMHVWWWGEGIEIEWEVRKRKVVPSRPMPHTIMEVKYEASQSCRGGESRSISGKKASSWRGNNGGAKVLILGPWYWWRWWWRRGVSRRGWEREVQKVDKSGNGRQRGLRVCEGRQMVKLCKQQATPVRQQAGTTNGTADGQQQNQCRHFNKPERDTQDQKDTQHQNQTGFKGDNSNIKSRGTNICCATIKGIPHTLLQTTLQNRSHTLIKTNESVSWHNLEQSVEYNLPLLSTSNIFMYYPWLACTLEL